MYSCYELSVHSLECYDGVYFPRYFTSREINSKITFWWVFEQFVTQVHTLFYTYILEINLNISGISIYIGQVGSHSFYNMALTQLEIR